MNSAAHQSLFLPGIPRVSFEFQNCTRDYLLVFLGGVHLRILNNCRNYLVLNDFWLCVPKSLLVKWPAWKWQRPLTLTWSWLGWNLRTNQGYRMKQRDISWRYGRQTASSGPAATPPRSSPLPSVWKASGPWTCTGWEWSQPTTVGRVRPRSWLTMSLRCRHLVCELTFGSLFCETPTALFMTGWTQQNI